MFRAHNFSAGPAVLPVQVLEETAEAVLNFNNSGMSIMEVSHRSKDFESIIKEAQADCLKIMNLSAKDYDVLFLGGGASTQFLMLAANFLNNSADYINTGIWAKKAIKEAKYIGKCNVIANSEDKNHNYIPKSYNISQDADFLHITTNNTVEGTEYKIIPNAGNIPLIGDMSSDIFSRVTDFSKFSLIYAGAQKNIGPAGVTLVVIKKEFLAKQKTGIATMLDYKLHIENESMYNTPPCLPIFVVNRVFKWILNQGLEMIQHNNQNKAKILYDIFDSYSDFYKAKVQGDDRSLMNVTFNLPTEELESKFVTVAKEKHNMTNLKGHRSVGGLRASIYNACPLETVQTLADLMVEFYKENK